MIWRYLPTRSTSGSSPGPSWKGQCARTPGPRKPRRRTWPASSTTTASRPQDLSGRPSRPRRTATRSSSATRAPQPLRRPSKQTQLSAAQDARDAWDRAHEAKRLAARAARQELDRRGIEPEPEHREPESLTSWWRQFEADAQAVERALDRQHQAAIDAGQPWPPKPAATARATASRAPEVIERLQQDGYLCPGLRPGTEEPAGRCPNCPTPARAGT